jgi:multidrug efflux system membrane fusion protein
MTRRWNHPKRSATRALIRRSKGARTRLAAAVLAAGLGLSLAAGGCSRSDQAGTGADAAVPVTVGQVVRKTMPLDFRAIGHVEAIETVAVKARIGGALQQIRFAEGDTVEAGATLFVIDQRPYQAALRQAEAQLAKDQAVLAKAEADVTRYADLVKQDYVTKEEYDQITADAAALRAAVEADQAAVESAQLSLDYCTITAPVTGRTGVLGVKVGDLIKANADTGMVTINRTRPIYVAFSVPAQRLAAILAHRDNRIEVDATLPGEGGPAATGELTFIDNAVDTATSTILLKATFPNSDERLWPGQFVDVTVTLGEQPDRVVCPTSAVLTGQQGRYVFVVADDDSVEQRPVEVDRMDEVDAVIADGLSGGETVVTDGQLRLVPGAKIQIQERSADGSDAT